MFERFTGPARQIVRRAVGEAASLDHGRVGTEHMLLAMIDEPVGTAGVVLRAAGLEHGAVRDLVRRRTSGLLNSDDVEALRTIGIDADAVLRKMTESFGPAAVSGRRQQGRGQFDDAAKLALQRALGSAIKRHAGGIGTEHLLLGLLVGDCTATAVLVDAGVDRDRLRANLLAELGKAA